MYYLAYGMNTNKEAMAHRCPKAKPMGGFYLPNYRLIFRGVADDGPRRCRCYLTSCIVGDHRGLSESVGCVGRLSAFV